MSKAGAVLKLAAWLLLREVHEHHCLAIAMSFWPPFTLHSRQVAEVVWLLSRRECSAAKLCHWLTCTGWESRLSLVQPDYI